VEELTAMNDELFHKKKRGRSHSGKSESIKSGSCYVRCLHKFTKHREKLTFSSASPKESSVSGSQPQRINVPKRKLSLGGIPNVGVEPGSSPTVGWIISPVVPQEDVTAASPSSSPLPIDVNDAKKGQHPSHSLLEENAFAQHKYEKFHAKCLKGLGKKNW